MLVLIMSCSTKYNLEKKSILNFNKSYYTEYASPIKGGESGFNIYLLMDNIIDPETKNVLIEGIYFKDKYCKLKNQGSNKYQGFIGFKGFLEVDDFEHKTSENSKNKVITEEIPFKLEENEAVIKYNVEEKQKYVKIVLIKKQVSEFPM